jgi:hypothetical protein
MSNEGSYSHYFGGVHDILYLEVVAQPSAAAGTLLRIASNCDAAVACTS